ncbi:MAG: tetratricopeptide repeat protein, partial [Myxococcales bacterium]|nr:tetratricopeptide repeat protein [Myxococcales bacterium]
QLSAAALSSERVGRAGLLPARSVPETGAGAHGGCGPREAERRAGALGLGGQAPCREGLVSNEDTAGHCCWPGQYWVPSARRCGGQPLCPARMETQANGDCDCARGMVRNEDTRGRCCWPGQVWLPSRYSCVGEPRCPEGLETDSREDCVPAGTAALVREGDQYRDGLGVAQEYARAMELYQRACEAGNMGGCTNLGLMYQHGRGVAQDRARAALFYQRVCEGGIVTAATTARVCARSGAWPTARERRRGAGGWRGGVCRRRDARWAQLEVRPREGRHGSTGRRLMRARVRL